MKIFSPVNHQATPPLTNPAHLLWHSGEEWRRSCSRPGYVLDSDCPGEGPKTALTNTRSSFQVLFAAHCLMLPIRSHSQRTSWRKMRAAAARGGRIGGGGEGGCGLLNGSWRISFFVFQNLYQREINAHHLCSAGDDDILWKTWSRDQGESVGDQSVRYWVCRWTFHWECLQSRWNFPSRSWTPLFTRVFLTRTTTINIQIFKGCWRKKEGFIL